MSHLFVVGDNITEYFLFSSQYLMHIWYDHVMPPIVSQSNDPANDALLGNVGPQRHLSRPMWVRT